MGTRRFLPVVAGLLAVAVGLPFGSPSPVSADDAVQALPFSQDWTNPDLITTSDDWSGVAGVIGYRGDAMAGSTGVDPQTVLADGTTTPVDVNANQSSPNTFTTGGVSEFVLADPVVALQGSGTARAPHLLLHVDTTGHESVSVGYNLRDVDGSADDAVQPVALQFRVGASGGFTNVPGGFVADATTGPSLATLVTPVSAALPAAAANQPLVQVRVITTDAVGSDEWVGIDDISITGSVGDAAPAVASSTPADGATSVAVGSDISITFTEAVGTTGSWYEIECTTSGPHSATVSGGPSTFTLDPDTDLAEGEACTVTVHATGVTDQDTNDPPDNPASDHSFGFTTAVTVSSPVMINELDADTPGTDTLEFVELYDGGTGATSLDGLALVFYNGSNDLSYAAFDLDGHATDAGGYFLLGNPGVTPAPGLTFAANLLQNGQDAVALYAGNASDFPNGSAVTTAGLVDAMVYDTSDADDPGLLVLLNAAQPQVNEDSDFNGANESSQRCPNGSGGPRNTSTYAQFLPTPGGVNFCVDDAAPSVSATNPANGAANVAVTADIQVTFSEPVNVTGAWFAISCTGSGAHPAIVTGGPTTFTLDPTTGFDMAESCTVTIAGAGVSDQDVVDPPNAMAADHVFSFSTFDPQFCATVFTHAYEIQGAGSSAAMTGVVTTQGLVVGDFEGPTGIGGFYLQDTAGDGDATTSDGIFVFTGTGDTVGAGQIVRVTGYARERFGETALNGSNSDSSPVLSVGTCGGGGTVAHASVEMPFPTADHLERYEGMLVRFPQALVISEYFNYDRFGELVLALPLDGETRHFTPTSVAEPGAEAISRAAAYALRRITLDDGLGIQQPAFTRHPNGEAFSLTNRFRGGDTVADTVGVLGFGFGLYRIQPTGPAAYASVNPRPANPADVGGRVKVAAMNTLNFFLSPDGIQERSGAPDDPADNICGPQASLECRGFDGDQPAEFDRQRDKLLAALIGLDADVIGLNELENTAGVDPLGDPDGIVAGLNEWFGPGTYAHVDTGVIGTDAIRVGLIYRPARVEPVGDHQILDSSVDARFIDTKSRPVLAQTFEEIATGERFTVAVNHLKSKGSDCNDVGDPDAGDGQGNCSGTRTLAARALVDWLASDPTGSGDPDFLVIGDLNSYAREDPIDAVVAGADDTAGTGDDYTNLVAHFQGTYAYSYVFDGQAGYLDHALSSAGMTSQVSGVTDWHINADEPDILDYDTTFKSDEQDAIFEPDAYRSSDHDAIVLGLQLASLSGKVTGSGSHADGSFEFSVQYRGNATLPSGSASFAVTSDGAAFAATGFDWLVVSGPRATFAGTGMLNGLPGYGFLASVVDGGSPGVGTDRIHLVVWELGGGSVIDQTAVLTSGNIVVHKPQ